MVAALMRRNWRTALEVNRIEDNQVEACLIVSGNANYAKPRDPLHKTEIQPVQDCGCQHKLLPILVTLDISTKRLDKIPLKKTLSSTISG